MPSQGLDHWNNGVHFFKVILETILHEEKLKIPISFVRRHWNGIENPVTLRLPNMFEKKVSWEKTNDYDVLFCDGWKEFANYLSLSESQFLVFQYQKNSLFNVIVFDKTGLEIKYPLVEISEESIEIEASENSLQVIEDPSLRGKPKSSSTKVFKKRKINPKEQKESKFEKRKVQKDERFHNLTGELKKRSRDLYEKVKNTFQSDKDFFICMMGKSYMERDLLGIPLEFGRKFLRQMKGGSVTLYVNQKETWIVDLKLTSNHQYILGCGWNKFRAHNNVKFGDVCVLMLNKDNGKVSFQVSIFSLEKEKTTSEFEGNTNIVPV